MMSENVEQKNGVARFSAEVCLNDTTPHLVEIAENATHKHYSTEDIALLLAPVHASLGVSQVDKICCASVEMASG